MIWTLIGGVIGIALYQLVVTPLVRSLWRRHRDAAAEECCLCGKPITGRAVHVVTSRPNDALERSFALEGGGSAVRSYVCRTHCPGGCNRRHGAKLAT